jgi:hypothetical protein
MLPVKILPALLIELIKVKQNVIFAPPLKNSETWMSSMSIEFSKAKAYPVGCFFSFSRRG